jgi:hypothetical protein
MNQGEARGTWITLTEGEMEHLAAVAREKAHWLDTQVNRFASRAERSVVGRRLNPSTAQVFFIYAQVVDPYGECDDLPPEADCVGREWFAMDPVERIAVHADDIPEETWILLDQKRRAANAEGWRKLLAGRRPT